MLLGCDNMRPASCPDPREAQRGVRLRLPRNLGQQLGGFKPPGIENVPGIWPGWAHLTLLQCAHWVCVGTYEGCQCVSARMRVCVCMNLYTYCLVFPRSMAGG